MRFFILIGIYVLLNSFGQLLIKLGTQEIGSFEVAGLEGLLNLKLITGIGLFGMSFLTWIYILSKSNLSYAFPFAVGLGYVTVILLAVLFLKEMPSYVQMTGMTLVGVGIMLMSWQGA
jgi:drug/metabolite transporter (DMT)-like permease